jgi:hypothetical protein
MLGGYYSTREKIFGSSAKARVCVDVWGGSVTYYSKSLSLGLLLWEGCQIFHDEKLIVSLRLQLN